MTGDEMERAIDFLLKGQANLELQVEKTSRQIAETDRQLAETDRQLAETNRQLAETNMMLRLQGDTLSTFIEVTTHSFSNLAAAQARTDERLNALIGVVEKHISQGEHGQAP